MNVINAYAPQVGCDMEEKEEFWRELDEVVLQVPIEEIMILGADFNGHVGEGSSGDEEVMGRYGVKERNTEGQMVVNFAKRIKMALVNTYFKKKEEHKFRDEVRQALGGGILDTWDETSNTVRDVARKILGVTSGQKKIDKETWWWNEEVQESLRGKLLAKKNWHLQQDEESRQKYKEMSGKTKRAVAKAKKKAYSNLYENLNTKEGEKDLFTLNRQRNRDGQDVQQVRMIKEKDGNVLSSEESVLGRWKEYFEELMNQENDRKGR
ncbi:uncharacterized protein LOC136085373 [Hydra vulgaris]|uniref:Uncharacterized protein LOC136085373 n=1 Tax=Hydra vulgaris TaxID=6087 RepID=A0ABM4CLT0_HYDVU